MSKLYLTDCNGNPIQLGTELGKGGEGTVFNILTDPNLVAKIYLKAPDQEKSRKIINMAGLVNERLLKLAAWPLKSIHKQSGEIVGFVMQKLTEYRPLFELYGPKLRLQKFPAADWRFLIHVAANTARAFTVIHEHGHVVGDVNHGNLLVAKDSIVKFIDTDSFQVSSGGDFWLCEVGVNTHQPPEMQGLSTYKSVIRNPNHDNFGLAVLIFQLLCLGRHPFSGRFSGNGDMPIEKAIAEYRFAYSKMNSQTQMNPPPASLPMNALPSAIQSLFERAFGQSIIRPHAKEWISALEALSGSLKTCQKNRGHYYLNSLVACPWCDIESKSNSTLFPVIVSAPVGHQDFMSLWQQVIAIKDPGSLSSLLGINMQALPSADGRAKEIGKKAKKLDIHSFSFLIGGVLVACVIGGCFEASLWQLVSVGIGIAGFIYAKDKKSDLIADIKRQLTETQDRWGELSSNWTVWGSNDTFLSARRSLDELKKKYDNLRQDQQYQFEKLWDNRYQQQFKAHLDSYQIADAKILGIGDGRKATLQSYGIETAADIELSRLEIGGFGPKLSQRLIAWKARCGKDFKFDPAKEISQLDIQLINRDIASKRLRLEQELSLGLAHLKRVADQIRDRYGHLYALSSNIRTNYTQALANAQEVGIEL